jgi:plasmid stabilization system protein ParE
VTGATLPVVWTPAARDDLRRSFEYLLPLNPLAALALAERLEQAAEKLGRMPLRGRPGRAAGTCELLATWPYIIVYEATAEEVRILRLWHGAQQRD